MSALTWIFLGVGVGLISPFMVLQLQRHRAAARIGMSPAQAPADALPPRNPFAGVAIRPCRESPCAAVTALADKRFLAVRAPALPVPGCDRTTCNCRYVRFADRRAPDDRREAYARFGGFKPNSGTNRRIRNDDRRRS
jgi:hypothetical protein